MYLLDLSYPSLISILISISIPIFLSSFLSLFLSLSLPFSLSSFLVLLRLAPPLKRMNERD